QEIEPPSSPGRFSGETQDGVDRALLEGGDGVSCARGLLEVGLPDPREGLGLDDPARCGAAEVVVDVAASPVGEEALEQGPALVAGGAQAFGDRELGAVAAGAARSQIFNAGGVGGADAGRLPARRRRLR